MSKNLTQERVDFLLDTLRPDNRPEVYEIPKKRILPQNEGYVCHICQKQGHELRRYRQGEIFMTGPANSPTGVPILVCLEHLPDNVVIYDPVADLCRDKSGQNTWRETEDKLQ